MGLNSTGPEGAKEKDAMVESKLEAVRSVPWYKLGCEVLSFDIHKLHINASGKLLVAVGSHQVAVVVLPTTSPTSKSKGGAFTAARLEANEKSRGDGGIWIDCRSMLLGTGPGVAMQSKEVDGSDARVRPSGFGGGLSVAANWSARTRVVDVLWHPLSTSDSHLLVLQANGTIKLFDISEDVDTPEQTMSLFGASNVGGAGFAVSRAVSFCMGSPASAGWSRVTVYVLTNTGEVYSLCPVLPRRCSVEQDWLGDLLETAELDVREWQAEEYETSECIYTPPELIDARAASKWLSQILDLERGRSKASAGGESMYITLTDNLMLPAIAQGPYLFQPEPMPVDVAGYGSDSSNSDGDADTSFDRPNADCNPDDACAILYMESTSGIGVGLVAIGYCDSHVELYADMEPVIGKWADTAGRRAHMRDLPVLATMVSIDLSVKPLAGAEQTRNSKQIGTVALVADTLSPTVFYALHSHGVHRVDMRSWTKLLDRAIGLSSESGRSDALEQMMHALGSSQGMVSNQDGSSVVAQRYVQCIVHTNPSTQRPAIPVIGAVIIDDIYLSYSLLALVEPSQLVGVALPLFTDSSCDVDDDFSKESGSTEADQTANKNNNSCRRLDVSLGSKDVIYVPRLPSGNYEVPSGLTDGSGAAILQQPRLVLRENTRGESGVSEERLKLLGSIVGQLHGQLEQVVSAHTAMQERLDLQVKEHQRQHEKLSAISSGFLQHIEQMRQSQKRLDALRENGQRLTLRVDQVLRQLISYYQPELTPSEKEFAQEVRGMDLRINGTDGYCQLVERLQERVSDIKALSKLSAAHADSRITTVAGDRPGMIQPQISSQAQRRIEQMLEAEQHKLQETCERISDIQECIDSIPESQLLT
ncbi:hypothetical protein COEREDRAFT_100353 [Coemansia reversa NRRL 1564]|uniref:Uncharacterized protein n=1 Tax=Coemansia reversa (strain ATCC 12441 / NRRL 1564) TaxID=763665 RepID=A0A2G5BJK4_COERN|nr:hypothetical protein COEREDRAFT_100353 [Coemansia reversa NRRL 1564]|eukprot:PIA19183.1 hypothetical protein COEREDRAFT_100353 [Coemansia reversa NRRL 1564]